MAVLALVMVCVFVFVLALTLLMGVANTRPQNSLTVSLRVGSWAMMPSIFRETPRNHALHDVSRGYGDDVD
eukprot:7484167-Alexandrium_andersonii.AAC.1